MYPKSLKWMNSANNWRILVKFKSWFRVVPLKEICVPEVTKFKSYQSWGKRGLQIKSPPPKKNK